MNKENNIPKFIIGKNIPGDKDLRISAWHYRIWEWLDSLDGMEGNIDFTEDKKFIVDDFIDKWVNNDKRPILILIEKKKKKSKVIKTGGEIDIMSYHIKKGANLT